MNSYDGQSVLIAGVFNSGTLGNGESVTDDSLDLKNFEKLPPREVPVSALSPGLYLRQGGTNAAHVQLLIDAAGSSRLPPILVQEDGWRVIDGLHRLEATKLCGDHLIQARFLDCTDSEALVLAMKTNSSHGLPLSKADRVSGASSVLTAHPDWSDRVIGDITGLSPKTVGALRNRSVSGAHLGTKRLGHDGRRRPVAPSEGRRRAAEYIGTHPNAPLRQVARETDVSLGTVHDVSAQLRRGVGLEPNKDREVAARPPVAPAEGAADVDGTPLRRKNHVDEQLTWAVVAAKMANDPTIRYTEGGKEFLRWMALHATDPDGWRELVSTIPDHWLGAITPIVDSISKEWGLFAEQLKSKQEVAR
jgi:hypothetical protein